MLIIIEIPNLLVNVVFVGKYLVEFVVFVVVVYDFIHDCLFWIVVMAYAVAATIIVAAAMVGNASFRCMFVIVPFFSMVKILDCPLDILSLTFNR